MKCAYCGKEIPKGKYIHKECKNHFCNKECYIKFQNTNIVYYFNGYVIVETKNKQKIFLDIEDYKRLNGKSICVHKSGYAIFWDKVSIKLHRFVMNCPDNMQIDHINRNKLDNRKCNLRICTNLENANNKGIYKNNKVNCKGVSIYNGIYTSRIQYNGKRIFLGNFKSLDEAIKARKKAEDKYFNG